MKKLKLILFLALSVCVLSYSFAGCAAVVYEKSGDGQFEYELYSVDNNGAEYQAARLVRYLGDAADVTIPATILGSDNSTVYPVEALGGGIFQKNYTREESRRKAGVVKENTTLKTVNIQADITEISDCAFYLCSELTSVTIPEGVKSIGGFAFFGCKKLQNLTLPSTVDNIGGYAFRDCIALDSVTILSTVRPVIGEKVFHIIDAKGDYRIINGLNIYAANMDLFDKADIEEEYKQDKIKDYLYWVEYINAGILTQAEQD